MQIENVCKKRKISLSFLPRMIGLTEWKQPQIVAAAQETPLRPSYVGLKRFDRYCWIAYADDFTRSASDDCEHAGSVRRRSANFFLAGARGLERPQFPDLQIPNLGSPI